MFKKDKKVKDGQKHHKNYKCLFTFIKKKWTFLIFFPHLLAGGNHPLTPLVGIPRDKSRKDQKTLGKFNVLVCSPYRLALITLKSITNQNKENEMLMIQNTLEKIF